jgi:hypothetical protein
MDILDEQQQDKLKAFHLMEEVRQLGPWTMGYFETIGKTSINSYDLSIDYGFWDVLRNKYIDLQGNLMSYKPKYSDIYGLGSYGAIAKEIQKAINK